MNTYWAKMKSGWLRFGFCASIFSLGATVALGSSMAQAAAEQATCRVHAVLASKEGDGELPRPLEFLRETLKDDQFAAYRSFHLVDTKTLTLRGTEPKDARFSSGHRLELTFLEAKPKLKFHLSLSGRDGTRNLLKTDYSIDNNGLFMIAAGLFKQAEVDGKLFFAIQCRV